MEKNLPTAQLTVIVPTLNERSNIDLLIRKLLSDYTEISIIVVDDGSTDGTPDIVRDWNAKNPKVTLLDRKEELIKGLTISLVDGIKLTQTEFFIVIDCDFQHPPEKIKDGLLLLTKGFELIVGTRTKIVGWSFIRKIISLGASTLGKVSLWLRRKPRPTDIMSGFFGGKTSFIQEIIVQHQRSFEPKGFKLLFDLLKKVPKQTQIGEFCYTFQARKAGHSKIGMKHIFVYFKSLF
ncbi:MAG: glycosyltransferase [Candidatus Hermodarchaeota archaeon]